MLCASRWLYSAILTFIILVPPSPQIYNVTSLLQCNITNLKLCDISHNQRSEIFLLERKRDRNADKSGLDQLEIKKLERLQKELRIVKDEAVKRKALAEQAQLERDKQLLAAQKTQAGVQKLNESKYSLKERFASVYYDETLNPFGAPAPGQRKLYYADVEGKTTTMDSRRAVVPTQWKEKFKAEGGIEDDNMNMGMQQEDDNTMHRKRRWDDDGGNAGNNNQQIPPPPPPPMQIMVSESLILFLWLFNY